ncbi:MAG: Na(+)-translocating NADH-quinone reductase subunit A [Thermoguttaceae bacterium]
MKFFQLTQGLDLPLAGSPKQQVVDAPRSRFVSLNGPDYPGMKPTILVQPGEHVRLGQVLFEDKKTPGVKFTAPASGTVREIRRGEKRLFQSICIECDSDEKEKGNVVEFKSFKDSDLLTLDPTVVRSQLVESGLWTAFRTRPFSKVPSPESTPIALFVTAIDTNPLAQSVERVISQNQDDFIRGLKILSRICGKKLFLCKSPNSEIPGSEDSEKPLVIAENESNRNGSNKIETAVFAGPHPAGLPGTHIHFLCPVGGKKVVWYIGYQDVIAIGQLFRRGKLSTERIVALGGPKVKEPVLLKTRLGAHIDELVEGKLKTGPVRIVSGSVLSGRTALGTAVAQSDQFPGLGRYHQQITVLEEVENADLFGWTTPGFRKFSITRTVASKLLPLIPFRMNTCTQGGHRAIFPITQFNDVMPLDILPTFLFQALENNDIELSESLGCLELDEEDLALCTFIDPGKNDYGKSLRKMLDVLAKEAE